MNTKSFDEKHFPHILNQIQDGVFITNNKGIALYLNETSTRQLGVTPAQVIGRHVSELEKEGLFTPSITKDVLKTRATASHVQTSIGRQYLATGYLVEIPDDDTEYVLTHVKDVTETVKASLKLEKTEQMLHKYLDELQRLRRIQAQENARPFVIGNSKKHEEMLDLIDRVAQVDATILLQGETGVGKSLIAEEIHRKSNRPTKPFIQINCSAIPETLLESELFGYTKGAFTGASNKGKFGLVEKADGGTLFLDEIAELPLPLQSKILQLVQNKSFIPVGSTELKTVDIRIITATNENLLEMVSEKRFREDLYYRLNVVSIHIPPLREREDDIIPLVYHYFNLFKEKYRKNATLSEGILEFFQSYEWPGNIRELENMVERLIITSKSDEIKLSSLPNKEIKINSYIENPTHQLDGLPLIDYLEKIEKEIIEDAREKHISTRKAAQVLGLTQSSFMRRLKKFNL